MKDAREAAAEDEEGGWATNIGYSVESREVGAPPPLPRPPPPDSIRRCPFDNSSPVKTQEASMYLLQRRQRAPRFRPIVAAERRRRKVLPSCFRMDEGRKDCLGQPAEVAHSSYSAAVAWKTMVAASVHEPRRRLTEEERRWKQVIDTDSVAAVQRLALPLQPQRRLLQLRQPTQHVVGDSPLRRRLPLPPTLRQRVRPISAPP